MASFMRRLPSSLSLLLAVSVVMPQSAALAVIGAVAAPSPQVTVLGQAFDASELGATIAVATAEAYDDVVWDVCDAAVRLNNFGATYDESAFCLSTSSPLWLPDLSVPSLCAAVLAPAGAAVVDVAASKTSLWTLDAGGTARGCVFPQLGATDIKSLVTRYRTSLTQYRTAGFNDVLRALDSCEQASATNVNACQVQDAKTKAWLPDPKKLPVLTVPPMPAPISGTVVTVTGVAAMSAGDTFQAFAKVDGTVSARCDATTPSETAGQCLAPSAAAGSLRVAANGRHALALRADGTVVDWGSVTVNGTSTSAKAPGTVTSAVDIAAGRDFSLALQSDGTVVAWGDNSQGQATVPATATSVVQIAAGNCHAAALRSDGKVVTWGCAGQGQGLAAGRTATAITAKGDRTVLWTATGVREVYGAGSAVTNISTQAGVVTAFDTASGRYFAGGGTCVVDKTEDVIEDEIAATSTKSDPPAGLTSASTPNDANQWSYTWTAPKRTGTNPITGYVGRWDNLKGRNWSSWETVTSPFRAPKAPSGLLTRFEVRAVTAAGLGAISHIATSEIRMCGTDQTSDVAIALTASAATPPVAPVMTASALSSSQLQVRWSAPEVSGGLGRPSYTVRTSIDGKTWSPVATRGYSALVAGLKSGTDYQVQVVSTNGVGSTTSATATVRTFSDAVATNLAASAVTGRSVTLTWKAPATVLGKDVKDYRVEWSRNGTTWTEFPHVASTKTTLTVTRLLAATSYLFRVTVITASGDGAATASLAVTTATDVPDAPAGLSAANVSSTGFDLSWSAPSDTGGLPLSGYTVTLKPNVGVTVAMAASGARVSGVKAGTNYLVTVVAKNSKGAGTAATTSVLVAVPPAAPTATVVRTGTGVVITWKAPTFTGGSKILGYRTQINPSTLKYTVAGMKATLVGLTTGTTFTFSVVAYNAIGESPALVLSTGTATAPGAVGSLKSSVKDAKSLTLTWSVPSVDGGSKITGYKLRTSADAGRSWTDWATAKSPATLPRPVGGLSVMVEVAAVNAVGLGTATGITVSASG